MEGNDNKVVTTVRKVISAKLFIWIISGFLFITFFIIVLVSPLMVLGIIDVGSFSNSIYGRSGSNGGSGNTSTEFVSTTDNPNYWWPVGTAEDVSDDGTLYDYEDPVSTTITSFFGPRQDPMGSGTVAGHNAIDIIPNGDYNLGVVNIIAAKDGTVIYPKDGSVLDCGTSTKTTGDHECGGRLGNYVKIEHNDGLITTYGHMYAGTITVKAGDVVKQGQVIGKMGSSGNSTGMHLHFAIASNDGPVDPLEYVSMENPRPRKLDNSEMVE